jgi:hypothetical protein
MARWVLILFWWGDFAASTSTLTNLTQSQCLELKKQISPPVGKMVVNCYNKGK